MAKNFLDRAKEWMEAQAPSWWHWPVAETNIYLPIDNEYTPRWIWKWRVWRKWQEDSAADPSRIEVIHKDYKFITEPEDGQRKIRLRVLYAREPEDAQV